MACWSHNIWLNLLLWCSLAALGTISVMAAGENGDSSTCPRDREVANQRRCFKKCKADDNCKGRRKCMCDGPCGMVCAKPRKQCKEPDPVVNGRVVALVDGKRNRTFGSHIRYTCTEGHILSGPSERYCQADGLWSGETPTCETEARCREPPWVPSAHHNGTTDVTAGSGTPDSGTASQYKPQRWYALGTQLMYRCEVGHNTEGFTRSMCMGEGRWVGPRMKCSPVRCGHPGNILHADRQGNVFVYPFKVKYTCRNGYRMVGSIDGGVRRCGQNGHWSGTPPTCIPIKCPRLEIPINGTIIGSDVTFGAVTRFYCQEGSRLVGTASRQCRMDGTWSGKDARCEVVDCGIPGPLHNGYLDIEGTTYKSKITFRCNSRTTFEGVGIDTRCQQNGTWSVGLPKCLKKCVVPAVTNGTILWEQIGDYADSGKKLQYQCNKGHQMNSTEELPQCHNGTWNFFPMCVPAPCTERPKEIRDGHVRFYTMRHGDKARYKCNTGYNLKGREFNTCEFGQWRGVLPHCAPVFCEHPGVVENGKILLVGVIGKYEYRPYVTNVRHNQEIEYHCHKEFKRVGPAAATCVGGKWSPANLPRCIQKHHPKILYIFRGRRSVDGPETTERGEVGAAENVQEEFDYEEEEKGLCEVPNIHHGHVSNYPTGYYVQHTSVLDASCDDGYTALPGNGLSQCDDGVWTWITTCLPDSVGDLTSTEKELDDLKTANLKLLA